MCLVVAASPCTCRYSYMLCLCAVFPTEHFPPSASHTLGFRVYLAPPGKHTHWGKHTSLRSHSLQRRPVVRERWETSYFHRICHRRGHIMHDPVLVPNETYSSLLQTLCQLHKLAKRRCFRAALVSQKCVLCNFRANFHLRENHKHTKALGPIGRGHAQPLIYPTCKASSTLERPSPFGKEPCALFVQSSSQERILYRQAEISSVAASLGLGQEDARSNCTHRGERYVVAEAKWYIYI